MQSSSQIGEISTPRIPNTFSSLSRPSNRSSKWEKLRLPSSIHITLGMSRFGIAKERRRRNRRSSLRLRLCSDLRNKRGWIRLRSRPRQSESKSREGSTRHQKWMEWKLRAIYRCFGWLKRKLIRDTFCRKKSGKMLNWPERTTKKPSIRSTFCRKSVMRRLLKKEKRSARRQKLRASRPSRRLPWLSKSDARKSMQNYSGSKPKKKLGLRQKKYASRSSRRRQKELLSRKCA